jgi:type II secretory pathway component PulC
MKHPFWIINSILLLLTVAIFVFILTSKVEIPKREDILPRKYSPITTEQFIQVNISKIYEHDIFGTYRKELPLPDINIPPIPAPPELAQPIVPAPLKPQFLDPLDINLKGITILGADASKNRIIIADNKTNRETNYRVGDQIEDGQIIRIFSNKIIILRANGQQEVLYLREQDAKKDPLYSLIDEWDRVVKALENGTYQINISEFKQRIKSLAQLIDILDLTTAYKQGISIGCRIGHLPEKSLGMYLGLQTGDIIHSINSIPATTLDNRLKIYKSIVSMQDNDTLIINLIRKKQEITITFILKDFEPEKVVTPNLEKKTTELTEQPEPASIAHASKINSFMDIPQKKGSLTLLTQHEKHILAEQNKKYKSTLNKINANEMQYMRTQGQKPRHLA